MASLTKSDTKELKDLINQRFNELDQRFNELKADNVKMSEQIHKLEIGQAKIDTRMDEWKTAINKIPDLAEKIGELKNWRQIVFVVITATVGGFFGWFLRNGHYL